MRLLGQVPSVQDAIRHFKDMALGKLPKKQFGKERKKLFGSWYDSGPSMMKRHPHTPLVTPVAMDLEQAESRLRRSGEIKKKRKKSTRSAKKQTKRTKLKGKGGKKKQTKKKKKSVRKPKPKGRLIRKARKGVKRTSRAKSSRATQDNFRKGIKERTSSQNRQSPFDS